MRTDYMTKRADDLKEMAACVRSSQIGIGAILLDFQLMTKL